MKHLLAGATALCVVAGAARAQPPPMPTPVIYPTSASLAVTTVSARVALPAGSSASFPSLLVLNVGSSEVFIATGDITVTATTSSIPIEPGGCVPIWVGASLQNAAAAATYIAAIADTGRASTIRVVQSSGHQSCGGNTSSARAVPVNISGSIDTGGTPQVLVAAAAAGVTRRISIQNLSTDPLCYSKYSVTPACGAAGTNILEAATSTTAGNGGSYTTPAETNDSLAFWIVGATLGNKFTAEYVQ